MLSAVSTYSRMEEDFENMINCKYSDRQFSLGLEKLFFSDAKLCSYEKKSLASNPSQATDSKDVHYAVMMSSFENYCLNYGLKNLMEKIVELSLNK